MKKKPWQLWSVRCILTVLLIGFVLWTWPGYLAHDYYVSETFSGHYETTETLSNYSVITQYFVPQKTHLASIQFAAIFNEENVENEKVEFVLYEESGREIFSEEILLEQIENGSYHDINVNKRVTVNEKYYWVLVGPETESVNFEVMYTNYVEDQSPDNTLFLLNDEQVNEGAQTISQYTYLVHPDKVIIIGEYWTGAVLAYIICMDVVNRFFGIKQESVLRKIH